MENNKSNSNNSRFKFFFKGFLTFLFFLILLSYLGIDRGGRSSPVPLEQIFENFSSYIIIAAIISFIITLFVPKNEL